MHTWFAGSCVGAAALTAQRSLTFLWLCGAVTRSSLCCTRSQTRSGFGAVQFWTHASRTPQEWLDALDAFKAQRFVRRVFLLGIPTARINAVHTAKGYPEVPCWD